MRDCQFGSSGSLRLSVSTLSSGGIMYSGWRIEWVLGHTNADKRPNRATWFLSCLQPTKTGRCMHSKLLLKLEVSRNQNHGSVYGSVLCRAYLLVKGCVKQRPRAEGSSDVRSGFLFLIIMLGSVYESMTQVLIGCGQLENRVVYRAFTQSWGMPRHYPEGSLVFCLLKAGLIPGRSPRGWNQAYLREAEDP